VTGAAAPDATAHGFHGAVREFTVPVEQGLVAAFAHAVGRPDPSEPPPTFAVVADRFDPEYPRRPPVGRGWVDGVPATWLHVEQWFTFHAPVPVGPTLTARRGPGRTWHRDGRSGGLTFVEERTELVDAGGRLCVATGWVDVQTEADHTGLTNAQRAPDPGPVVRGRDGEHVLVDPLTATHIVLYVAAAGDFHPLHHDDAYARAEGYPSIFAPGMLTLALTAGALLAARPARPVQELTARFRAQVWPGDTLFASWAEADDGAWSVRTRNQHDTTVLELRARCAPA